MRQSSKPLATQLRENLRPYAYRWPHSSLRSHAAWTKSEHGLLFSRQMPEDDVELEQDSRWPAFFPSPICLVTTGDGKRNALEKVVGASIVNRFPYLLALSFCRTALSSRHHPRQVFCRLLEENRTVAVQFLPPGENLNRVMNAILTVPEERTETRLEACELSASAAHTSSSPVFDNAFLVYEGRLAKPGRDFDGEPILVSSHCDAGSHRIYFFEITAIQLKKEIAVGREQIHWRSLPDWTPRSRPDGFVPEVRTEDRPGQAGYQKGYQPRYAFPSPDTVVFEWTHETQTRVIKELPPLPEDQVEVDNDRARWPCFFPQSAGLITVWDESGLPNLMPCGSTTLVSRHPLIISPCVSYGRINERYAPRSTLDLIRKSGRFGCGVPYLGERMVNAIRYAGNVSFRKDPLKVSHAGLEIEKGEYGPILTASPIHFECEVVGEEKLGTHSLFLGEVRRIHVREDVTPDNPLEWCPWADLAAV